MSGQNHADRAHARFAPSAAERWINCPGSIRAQAGEPDIAGEAAEAGTRCHEAASAILEGEDFDRATRGLSNDLLLLVEEYTSAVASKFAALRRQDPDARMIVERRMRAPQVHPEYYGTGDVLMIARGVLHVDDLKTGWKPVAVRYPDGRLNYQLASYVLLALAELGVTVGPWLFNPEAHGFTRIVLTVHQPRVYDRPEQTRVTVDELRDFLTDVVGAIDRVEAGDDIRRADPSWCRYCLARGRCPELRKEANRRAKATFRPENLPLDMAAELLAEADWLEAQAKGAREAVYRSLSVGRAVPGSKLVAKKGRREWTDFDRAERIAVAHGIPRESLYRRQPISPAQMETLVGLHPNRKDFPWALWNECLENRSGGNTVVPETDPRPEIRIDPGQFFRDVPL